MEAGRERLARCLAFDRVRPPRFENDFHEDVPALWARQGAPAGSSLEQYFQIDARLECPVEWRPQGKPRAAIAGAEAFAQFRRAYDPERPPAVPPAWIDEFNAPGATGWPRFASPWDEGLLQVLGVRDNATFRDVMTLVAEQPAFAAEVLDAYAECLVVWLDRLLPALRLDFAFFYEPIASNHAPVVSPTAYQRIAGRALRRVCQCLARHGVAHRFMWSSGRVAGLIPIWLDAGITGLHITQRHDSGISYVELRHMMGPRLEFFGGVDSRALAGGAEAIACELANHTRPLLEQGGYVPYLDDRIRPHVTFAQFREYRRQLDDLLREMFGE